MKGFVFFRIFVLLKRIARTQVIKINTKARKRALHPYTSLDIKKQKKLA